VNNSNAHILFEKILNFFICVRVRMIVVKWNTYEAHFFPCHLYNHAVWKTLLCDKIPGYV